MKYVFLFLLPALAQANYYKPSDLVKPCSGSFTVSKITNIHTISFTVPSRSPIPQIGTKTVANLEITPTQVAAGCEQMGEKYKKPVEYGSPIQATMSLYGNNVAAMQALLGKSYAFSIEHSFGELDAHGNLPLFPKYYLYEGMNFKNNLDGLITSIDGKESLDGDSYKVDGTVNTHAVYGVPEFPKTDGAKINMAKALLQDIENQHIDPVQEKPFFWLLSALELGMKDKTLEQEYLQLCLAALDSASSHLVGFTEDSGLYNLVREINNLFSYEFGIWGNTNDQAMKIQALSTHPLLFSGVMLKSGYEYTVHLSTVEIETVLGNFLSEISAHPAAIFVEQVKAAAEDILQENQASAGHYAPQYTLSAKALGIIQEIEKH